MKAVLLSKYGYILREDSLNSKSAPYVYTVTLPQKFKAGFLIEEPTELDSGNYYDRLFFELMEVIDNKAYYIFKD